MGSCLAGQETFEEGFVAWHGDGGMSPCCVQVACKCSGTNASDGKTEDRNEGKNTSEEYVEQGEDNRVEHAIVKTSQSRSGASNASQMSEGTANAARDGFGGLSSTLLDFTIIILQKRAFGKIIGRAKWKFDGTIRLNIFNNGQVGRDISDGVLNGSGYKNKNQESKTKHNDGSRVVDFFDDFLDRLWVR